MIGKKRKRVVKTPPSGGACETCRQRRVKCDESRPACKRCALTGRDCPGYRILTVTFASPEEIDIPAENALSRQTSPDSPISSVSSWPHERTQILSDFFEMHYPGGALGDARQIAVLGAILNVTPTTAVLASCLETMCYAHLARKATGIYYLYQSYTSYAHALELLRRAVMKTPDQMSLVKKRELLASIVLLMQLDDRISNNQAIRESWRVHLWAALEYAATYGTEFVDLGHPLDGRLMLAIQSSGGLLAVARRTALPLHASWLEHEKPKSYGISRPFLALPAALQRADIALKEADDDTVLRNSCIELENLRLDQEAVNRTWAYSRKTVAREQASLDEKIEEHGVMSRLDTFDAFYDFSDATGVRRFVTAAQIPLVVNCTLLRLVHSNTNASTWLTHRSAEEIELDAFNLARDMCQSAYYLSQVNTLANSQLLLMSTLMAQQFFSAHGDTKEAEWCTACAAATRLRIERIRPMLPPTRCRIDAITPGWVDACKYSSLPKQDSDEGRSPLSIVTTESGSESGVSEGKVPCPFGSSALSNGGATEMVLRTMMRRVSPEI